ncbi:MAG: DUF4080 domain-containing protein [Cellulosilyticum sp.]|nr:DUF4080 domain-containing protein [Cellulosilyticum sp.]
MKVLLLALNAKFIHTSLALRYIKAYCHQYDEQIQILETSINNNENEIIKAIYKEQPNIIGISCYIWNMSYIKMLIPTLKKILPDTTIILGGPEVSYEGESLLSLPEVDLIMEGEGEETWKEYLDYRIFNKGHISDITGLVYRNEQGEIHKNKARKPLDLNHLPFVYENLEGLEHKIIYYEASRGCPFNCQYCLSSIEQGVRFVPLDKVKQHMAFFLEKRVKQVKFVDRTFNARRQYAMDIWTYLIENDNGYTNFHFEIAAELIHEEMYSLLKKARPGLIQFEIGVQSTNENVLKIIKRPMPFKDIKKVVERIRALGNIHQHLDLIAGLPEEDYSSFRQSFNDVMSLRPEQFQLGFLKLLKGSGLREKAKEYGLIYKAEPPYEILYTSSITYDEILRLHAIDDLVDRYYNNGRFSHSLEYFFDCYEQQPFDFFEALSKFWEEKGYDVIEHNKMAYYKHLVEFAVASPKVNEEILKEMIRLDYLIHEPIKEMPAEFETIHREELKEIFNSLLKDDEWVVKYLPHLQNYAPRQRYRSTYLDAFKYPVWQSILGEKMNQVALRKTQKILFDYSFNPPKWLLINEE